ncbi:proton-coupled zinc antiporter SLC30A2-like isoform X1 [Metopolophium dirhodum]|uniref:proton-coupled zinc antiporter SLC30A2-like isoform X1 n=1 Tax=Metopolophium dirhodum TaxID=44670 RepID=UPI00298F4998|nr:proton-coupled zinc antiporter SLC30A2-like isoform X1 [Metopolophium dirhodum]
MSVIDATVPPAASTTITREDGNGHSDRRRRQQQQQQQQHHDHGSATSVGAGGVTFDDLDDTDAAVSIVVDGATDRTPLLTRRVTYRDEEGSCNDRGVDRVVVDGLGESSKYGSVNEDVVFMSTTPTMTGAFVRQPSTGSGKLVYCIHGKPSGCCATLQVSTEDSNSNHETPDPVDAKPPITIFNEHCHPNRESTSSSQKARRKLIFASILCLLFMIGEGVGGYLSSSLAIATDASHLLTDFASFMISLCAIWVASRPATQSMPFGWYRAEVLGALTSVLLIWVVTGVLLYLAVERLRDMTYTIDADIMLITSAVGLCVNLVMGLTLHQHSHSHGGGSIESHSHDEATGRSTSNINVRAAYIHVLGDIIQSLGVLIAAVIVYFRPDWKIVDPICTFMFSLLVLVTTFNILRDTMIVLMEGMPKGVNFSDVLETFMSIDGVVRVHNLRVWALSPDKIALAAHLAVRPGANTTTVLKEASRRMYKKYNFFDCTLQIEEFETQMENCKQCQPPIC